MTTPPPDPHHNIAERLGPLLLRKRLHRQANMAASLTHQGEGALALERIVPIDRFILSVLRMVGLASRGRANCLDIEIVNRDQPIPRLPSSFDGFRLLQLSDIHLDLLPELPEAIISRVHNIPHDLAVITGDFTDHPTGHFNHCLQNLSRILPHLALAPLAILGNHDIIENVAPIENLGIRVLLNENIRLTRNNHHLWIAGIDDPCFYRTHDLSAAKKGIPDDAASILLSHGPETFAEAAYHGFSFMLSGHTHGGQICLPGGIAVVRNGHCPPAQFLGAWQYENLYGYTARGTGSCGVPARFNCRPEITLHTLRSS